LNTKQDILKNVGNQTVDVAFFPTMEVNGVHLFDYQHSLKYLLFCSTEETNMRVSK